MELNDLKLFAAFYIKEQRIVDKDKVELLNFIECADGDEILFLLAHGQIPSETNLAVKEAGGQAYRLEFTTGDLATKFSKAHMQFGMPITTMATSIAFKINKEQMIKLSKKCETEKGAARKMCYKMIRRDAIRAEILALSSMKTKCHKSKNAETCIKHIDQRIKELQQRMDKIKMST